MSSHQNRRTQELASCRNLGSKSAEMLKKAGIKTPSQLAELGSVQAFLRVKKSGSKPSLNLLWALEGALTDRDWRDIYGSESGALKEALRRAEKISGHQQ